MASFYPLFEAAERVGGDRVEVGSLVPPGIEPHDVEQTSRDADALLDADVVLFVGGGFQPVVQEFVASREGGSFDVLGAFPPGSRVDPHVWLDPVKMQAIVERIAEAFSEADPPGSSVYAANARDYGAEIARVHQDYLDGLASCDRRLIVATHAALGHLAARYGLQQEAISGSAPEGEPDPRRFAELADLVRRGGVTTIFTEPLTDTDAAATLARETGAGTAVLNPLEGLTEEQAARGETYISVMHRNLEVLRAALGCR
ncbi:MAG: zinc ABC transporter substrate-binding protein [Actinobacteria bacterium]|nr:zinc ABC transporter substrate-binding protein [Actinomycetota bacterium]